MLQNEVGVQMEVLENWRGGILSSGLSGETLIVVPDCSTHCLLCMSPVHVKCCKKKEVARVTLLRMMTDFLFKYVYRSFTNKYYAH